MKNNKLYTVSRGNIPAFMPKRNLFDVEGVQTTGLGGPGGYNFSGYTDSFNVGSGLDYNAGKAIGAAIGASKNVSGGNVYEDKETSGGLSGMQTAGMASNFIDSVPTGDKRGMWDTLDPVYHLAGGRESGAGNALSDAGVGLTKAGLQSGQPYMALAGAALKVVGGLTNAAFGIKENTERKKAVDASISTNRNFISDADSFDGIKEPTGITNTNVYKGGWFSGGKARRKNEALKRDMINAFNWADASVENNAHNIFSDKIGDTLRNYSAFGGPLDLGGGALDYGLAMDYLTIKKRESENKNKLAGLTQMPAFMPQQNTFALGGVTQSHGGDWSNGTMHVDAGQSHELNPNEGVQVGVDNEGIPNLVEEGERIFDDYVYSKRIYADGGTLEKFHLSKKRKITFADLAELLEKESKERENDPISIAGLKAQMHQLADEQERQKQEMEAERAKAAFEALSPEEQTALMQQKAQQERMAQEQAAQQQVMAEQQSAIGEEMGNYGGISPNPMMADGSQPNLGVEPQMNACGGRINRYDEGGKKNVGDWKDEKQNHWDVFTKPGLKRYIENLKQKLNMAPDDETKDAIRREAINDLNSLQQSYFTHVLPGIGADKYVYSDDILNHQKTFDRLYGNTGFYSKDENGNVRNLIAEAINLPTGAATEDKPDNWFDGYSGPRTSIRNFGSTEYGNNEYYQDLVDEFKKLGLTYAPNENWSYGDGKQLYALSMANTEPATEPVSKIWDWNSGNWVDKPQEQQIVTPAPSSTTVESPVEEDERGVVPIHRAEWPRYAGLLGPAVGLGLQMAGVGRPDTGSLDAAISGAGDVTPARWKPIGNYLTYRPLDIWYEQNALNAQSRATDRSLMNTSSPSRAAGILANGYNSQIASGNLFRQAQEYNDSLRKQVEEFNRGTDQFNAEAYNRNSQFNADAYNRARQANAQLKLQAAREKIDADSGWYNGIYGNLSGLFKGISDLGRENAQRNQVADMAATGIFGTLTPNSPLGNGLLRYETDDEYFKRTGRHLPKKANGGKMKKRGLTF